MYYIIVGNVGLQKPRNADTDAIFASNFSHIINNKVVFKYDQQCLQI